MNVQLEQTEIDAREAAYYPNSIRLSIAISLKRIADHLDKPSYTQLGDALDLSINPNANRT